MWAPTNARKPLFCCAGLLNERKIPQLFVARRRGTDPIPRPFPGRWVATVRSRRGSIYDITYRHLSERQDLVIVILWAGRSVRARITREFRRVSAILASHYYRCIDWILRMRACRGPVAILSDPVVRYCFGGTRPLLRQVIRLGELPLCIRLCSNHARLRSYPRKWRSENLRRSNLRLAEDPNDPVWSADLGIQSGCSFMDKYYPTGGQGQQCRRYGTRQRNPFREGAEQCGERSLPAQP